MTRVNRKSPKRRNNQSPWQPRAQVSESSSHIANIILFAIHHARSSCYIPARQTGNPQVCWLSDVVQNQSSYSSINIQEGADLGKMFSLRSDSLTTVVRVRGAIWLQAGVGGGGSAR